MHLHRRPQPPPRPLRQSLLKDLFHHRDTEDTEVDDPQITQITQIFFLGLIERPGKRKCDPQPTAC